MSEERFDRLENQLTQVIQSIATMQQHISGIEQKVSGIEQKVSGIEQNVNAAREDIASLRNRIDSVEGAVSVVIRGTFTAHQKFNTLFNRITGLSKYILQPTTDRITIYHRF